MKKKTALVLGAGGFIGSHLVRKLKKLGYWVRAVDLKYPEFSQTEADEFIIGDLRNPQTVSLVMFSPTQNSIPDEYNSFDEVYQMAADMGGAAFVFTKENDYDIIHNSAMINLNVSEYAIRFGVKKIFYSSSACIYPQNIQEETDNNGLKEDDAYPAFPDSDYGYEKIISERLYDAARRNKKLNIRVARFHNIFGEYGTWDGGREKSPAAICRKVAKANDGDDIEIWGDGLQTRSFLYIDECIYGVLNLMKSDYQYPINIGSDEMISINDLARMVIGVSGKKLGIKNVPSNAIGVRGRNSDNTLCKNILNWSPTQPLKVGMEKLYSWVNKMVNG